jgi:hypothetical protein
MKKRIQLNKDQARALLENRANMVAKSMRLMVSNADKFSIILDQEVIRKIEAYVKLRLDAMIRDLIVVSASTASTRAEFSLDMDLPSVPSKPVVTVSHPSDIKTTDKGPTRLKATGRLIDNGEPVIEEVPIFEKPTSIKKEPDGSGFIDG